MDIKKLFIGGIVGGILFFLLGWLIYGNLLLNFMHDNPGPAGNLDRTDKDMEFLYIAIGSLLQGFLIAYIFVKANVSSVGSGFITGGVVGLLMTAGIDCIMYGTSTILSKKMMAADVAAATVMAAVIGAIVGLVMNVGKKTS